jgi:hypothetical protein
LCDPSVTGEAAAAELDRLLAASGGVGRLLL